MKNDKENKKTKQTNTTIGNIDNIPGEVFNRAYEEYTGYINNDDFYYKKNELYSSLEERELAYDDLVNFIKYMEPHLKQYGISSSDIANKIEGQRGKLSITEIKNYKQAIKEKYLSAKNHTEYFNEFKSFYEEAKLSLEHSGATLENNFEEYLNPKNKDNHEYISYSKAKKELTRQVEIGEQKRKDKLDYLTKELEKRSLTIFTYVRQKKLISTSDLSMNDLEEIEEIIKLIDKINEKLKIININLIILLNELKLNIEKLGLKELEIINTNIEEYLMKENLEREIAK